MAQTPADLLVCEEDLQAYIDGRLDVRRRDFIEDYLIRHTDEAARVAASRSQNLALHEAFDQILDQPLPPAMEELVARLAESREPPTPQRGLLFGGALAAGIVLSVTSGWLANEWMAPQRSVESLGAFTQRAFEAHAQLSDEMTPAATAKDGGNSHALVQWMTQRTTRPFQSAPDLRQFGLTLTGGRVFLRRELPVAQLIYESADDKLSLYVGTSHEEAAQSAITFMRKKDLSMFYWKQDNLEFSVVGKMGKEDLLTIANAIHDQLGAASEMPSPTKEPSGTLTPAEGKSSSSATVPVGEKVPLRPTPVRSGASTEAPEKKKN